MAAAKGNKYAIGNSGGRPVKEYNKEIAAQMCEIIATSSKGLQTIIDSNKEFPSAAVFYRWLSENEDFAKMYQEAKDRQADLIVEEMLEIADDARNDYMLTKKANGELEEVENREWINRSRLRVDTRKWIAAKLKPKKYGDKVELGGNLNFTNEPIKFE